MMMTHQQVPFARVKAISYVQIQFPSKISIYIVWQKHAMLAYLCGLHDFYIYL